MVKPPRRPRPQKRKSDLPTGDAVASRAVVPRKRDARQPGIFDRPLPAFIGPQLAKLVTEAPEGERWAHELKFDGYRMRARIDRGRVQLITARSALDWTSKYPGLADWLKALPVERAYLDGELCAVRPDGTTSFSLMQAATEREGARLVYVAFDLLHLNGDDLMPRPLLDRKAHLPEVLKGAPAGLQYSAHVVGHGTEFFRHACQLKAEGIVSKRADAPYRPRDRSGAWLNVMCGPRRAAHCSAVMLPLPWVAPPCACRRVGLPAWPAIPPLTRLFFWRLFFSKIIARLALARGVIVRPSCRT